MFTKYISTCLLALALVLATKGAASNVNVSVSGWHVRPYASNHYLYYGYYFPYGNYYPYYSQYYYPYWYWHHGTTIQGDWLRGIAQLRIATAQAMYQQMLARQQYDRARAYEIFLGKLQTDLKNLDRQLIQAEKFQKKIASHVKGLNSLLNGVVSSNTTQSIYFFLKLVDAETHDKLVMLPVEALPLSDFDQTSFVRTHYNRETKEIEKVAVEIEPFPGGTLLDFLKWMNKNPVKMKKGTKAQTMLLEVRNMFIKAGEEWYAKVQAQMEEVDKQKDDVWKQWKCSIGMLPARDLP